MIRIQRAGAQLPRSVASQQVIAEFAVGAGQITSILRLPLAALVGLIGLNVPRDTSRPGVFLALWLVYVAWSVGVLWWMFNRPVPTWSSWLTTFADLAAFIALAAASAGGTSFITPVFYLYPVAVAFHYRPRLTAVVGALIALGYIGTWLPHLGKAGGPSIPLVVWLYAGFLLWLATASTTLTVMLVRRSSYVLNLLAVQEQLTAETLAVAETERAHLAEDLHDGALQNLIAMRRNIEALSEQHPGSALLEQTDALLRDTSRALRGTVSALHPQVLAQLGLRPALIELLGQYRHLTGLTIHASLAEVGRIPQQDLLFSTARELLGNIVKHAQAQQVWLTLALTSTDQVTLDVADDGSGFDPQVIADRVAAGHIGLASRSVRIAELGGTITITPRKPAGTHIHVALPTASSPPIGR